MVEKYSFDPIRTGLCVILGLILIGSPIALAQENLLLKDSAAVVGVGKRADDATVVRARFVNIDLGALGETDAPAGIVVLNLFEDTAFTAVFERTETNVLGSFAWIGHLEGIEYGHAVLVVTNGVLAGHVSMPGADYEIAYVGNGVHAVRQIDQSLFPPEMEPIPGGAPEETPASEPRARADACDEITVLVAYTPEARAADGGTANMEARIALAVTETNQSYVNSGLVQQINLVHTMETTAGDAVNDFDPDLSALQNLSDGIFDNVDTARETYYADEVVLIIENTSYCGLAYVNSTVATAFAVVHRTCATGYYSFGHELGHNMGARHDWYVDATDNYHKGFVNMGDLWRTIMAYNSLCADHGTGYCSRLQYWSNPDVSYGSPPDPMGVISTGPTNCVEGSTTPDPSSCAADNRTRLNNTCDTVANFRSAPSITIAVEKLPNPDVVTAPGENVTFTVRVENTGAVEGTLNSLTDNVFGDLHGQGSCAVPQTIPAGGTYECSFTGFVGGAGGDIHQNTVTAVAGDAAGAQATADGSAEVRVQSPPVAVCDPFSDYGDGNCCIDVAVSDIDGGSYDPDGPGDVASLCITAVDGSPAGCVQTVEVCDDGSFAAHAVTLTITDQVGASDSCDATVTVLDGMAPTATCDATGGVVDSACNYVVPFTAVIEDNCCVDKDDVTVTATLLTGNATLGAPSYVTTQVSANRVEMTGGVLVSNLTGCPATVEVRVYATDCAGLPLTVPCSTTADVVDETPPTAYCAAYGGEVDDQCEYLMPFEAIIFDNCCVQAGDVDVAVELLTGNATLGTPTIDKIQDTQDLVVVLGSVLVSDLTSCPATVQVTVDADDCCGNPLDAPCVATADVVDRIPPEIVCPDPITLERGDKICNDDVQNWLDSTTATDNCDPDVDIVDDSAANGFECGFPFDSTTTVTWTATDDCENESTCSSTITIKPAKRVDIAKKGSLLIYPKVEVKWDAAGDVMQDTFVTITNDYTEDVFVHWYFVNGDEPLGAVFAGDPPTEVERAHPGWNWVNCTTRLTQNEPTYFSALTGLPAGCQPFTTLDDGGGIVGRPDLEADDGSRVLRGYMIAYAVDNFGHEITSNHLSGGATIVSYAHRSAWEYDAYAFQATCGEQGDEPLDCTRFDENGTCCEAEVIPGRLDTDGFQYDIAFEKLLLDFFAVGSQAFSQGGVGVMLDTDLTLLPVTADLQQDTEGPVTTKAHFDIWNANEDGFSGTTRCITCWDQTLLSNYELPNQFMMEIIHTDKGKARIEGVASDMCDPEDCVEDAERVSSSCSQDAALLGVAAKILAFRGHVGRISGDWNRDAHVDLTDYAAFAECQGLSGPGRLLPPGDCRAVFDFDGDADVDLRDYQKFLTTFGRRPTAGRSYSGATLVGQGREAGTILTDVIEPANATQAPR